MSRLVVIGLTASVVAGCGSATRTVTVETHTVTHTVTRTVTRPARPAPIRRSSPTTTTAPTAAACTPYSNDDGPPACQPSQAGHCPAGYTPNADGGVLCIQASTSCGVGFGAGEFAGPHADCALIQAGRLRVAAGSLPGVATFTQNGQKVAFNCTEVGAGPPPVQAPVYRCVSQQDPLDWFQFSFT